MVLDIPAEESYCASVEAKVTAEHQAMLKSFVPTVKGKIIQVDYFLKFYIKHDSWNNCFDG